MEKIPFRQSLFWDVDPKTIDPEKHSRYIIERILDFGDDNEVRWMWNHYDHATIRDVLERSRVLFPATRSFWGLMLST
ncbi:MAG: hypothetical protein G01um101417_431 [Parcubacteria group bacterium Gr01-1014_17]|nr:MAG: hypothetical protein G01um101417_431 [Parcubacteria group bacterium Gr01-1014_17]